MQKPSYFVRLKAFLIDYVIIIAYALVLFLVTYLITGGSAGMTSPLKGQFIGFFTLTLPVVLYFIISEAGKKNATIGKRKFKLKITNNSYEKPSALKVVIRNVFKFLPWEIAHTFVHQLISYVQLNEDAPVYVYAGLVIPQVIALAYIVIPLLNKKQKNIYDYIAGTLVIKESNR